MGWTRAALVVVLAVAVSWIYGVYNAKTVACTHTTHHAYAAIR